MQLRRRVREMREARVVATTQKPEQEKTAVPKKDLNSLQSFPRGMECVDPLKLGYFCSWLKNWLRRLLSLDNCANWDAVFLLTG